MGELRIIGEARRPKSPSPPYVKSKISKNQLQLSSEIVVDPASHEGTHTNERTVKYPR